MRILTRNNWGCIIILSSTVEIVVATGANLMKSSQLMKRVWSFNYPILIWFLYAFYLIHFISAFIYLLSLQLSISVVINFQFVHLDIKVDCTIVIAVAFLVISIPVETILNIHHFTTRCVHLHIGINSNWLKINQQLCQISVWSVKNQGIDWVTIVLKI